MIELISRILALTVIWALIAIVIWTLTKATKKDSKAYSEFSRPLMVSMLGGLVVYFFSEMQIHWAGKFFTYEGIFSWSLTIIVGLFIIGVGYLADRAPKQIKKKFQKRK